MNAFADVASLDELPPGAQKVVLVGGTRVLLCREAGGDPADATVWAVHDRCSHAFQPLAGGTVRRGEIQCPKHGACFDLATGKPTNAVTNKTVAVYPVQVVDGRILVGSQPGGAAPQAGAADARGCPTT